MKYAAADSINAALSTYAPTASPMTPPPSQRAAFPIKEENLDNGDLKMRATVGPTVSALDRDQVS